MDLTTVLALSAPEEAAPHLLGCILVSTVGGERTAVRLTEVEAYSGSLDPASHAFRGITARNATMFRRGGHLYCYLSYGIHTCANIVVGDEGVASGILLRGAQPLVGIDVMRRRRGRADHLVDGPGKLAQALGIGLHHDGSYLLERGPLSLEPGDPLPYVATPRVGISRAVDLPWRFAAVSTRSPAPARTAPGE